MIPRKPANKNSSLIKIKKAGIFLIPAFFIFSRQVNLSLKTQFISMA